MHAKRSWLMLHTDEKTFLFSNRYASKRGSSNGPTSAMELDDLPTTDHEALLDLPTADYPSMDDPTSTDFAMMDNLPTTDYPKMSHAFVPFSTSRVPRKPGAVRPRDRSRIEPTELASLPGLPPMSSRSVPRHTPPKIAPTLIAKAVATPTPAASRNRDKRARPSAPLERARPPASSGARQPLPLAAPPHDTDPSPDVSSGRDPQAQQSARHQAPSARHRQKTWMPPVPLRTSRSPRRAPARRPTPRRSLVAGLLRLTVALSLTLIAAAGLVVGLTIAYQRLPQPELVLALAIAPGLLLCGIGAGLLRVWALRAWPGITIGVLAVTVLAMTVTWTARLALPLGLVAAASNLTAATAIEFLESSATAATWSVVALAEPHYLLAWAAELLLLFFCAVRAASFLRRGATR